MAAEITQIDTQNFTTQTYDGQDTNLLSTFDTNTSLSTGSYIEYFVYDNNQNLLSQTYNFTQYTVQNDGQSAGNGGNINKIIIDPEQVLIDSGFDQGEYITYFNFLNKQIGSNLQQLYISEISSDKTELRLDSTSLTNIDIIEQSNQFIQEREESSYFLDFYLNFGENQLTIANNISLDTQDPNNPTILIKLYESLPDQFDLNTTLWVVTSIEEPRAYKVTFEETPIIISDTTNIKGPNFNLDLKDQVNNSTLELSYIDLLTTSLTSSQNQLNSLLEEKELDINIDYTDFSNFVHFSSAQTRLENFYYKIQLIEQYSSSIAILNNTSNSTTLISSSTATYESKIDNIITNFDGYEYYLYYETGSTAWPKTNNQKPYILEKSNSSTVLTWIGSANEINSYYGGLLLSASIYDNENKDNLLFTLPEYLRDDPDNKQYELFVDMVGQFYDNIWVYYKDVTQKYNNDNRLEYGISKDIVADAIRDFGIKLYQNNFSNEDLYTAFLGITPEGGLFPFPNITGSLPTPSGFEYVDTLISASSDYIPLDDVNKSLYKRIYHNLPYLLKSKGTLPGLRALITSYGVPDTILRINEFGGKDKINSNDWDLWQQEFNYAFDTEGNNNFYAPWPVNNNWNASNGNASTIEFRFKAEKFPPTNLSQSLLGFNAGSGTFLGELVLQYTGSGLSSGSYSGSIIDPYYQYANLTFYPSSSDLTLSASVYLPFFNNGWWSVMLTSGSNGYELYSGNNIYEGGENNTELGFYSSSSIQSSYDSWSPTVRLYFATGSLTSPFSGSLQEVRFFKNPLSESVFKDYIMNPYSTEGNSLNSSPDELIFRASLGGELYTESISIHPKITGSWQITQSFDTGDSDFVFYSTPTFVPNTEFFFTDQPIAGIKNIISDKIRIENNVLPSGDTLSQYRALSQQANISQSYTPNINYLEVAFSPQNEINEDIMSQIGYFNIGEFIGDPRLRSSSAESYPALDQLRNEYFTKYIKNYNLTDFIRLIKFFDNSLFKMIRDFVPARTSLASGIVIKQHLLERNKYPQPQVLWEDLDISGTLKPTWNGYEPGTVEHFEGGTGGSFERFNLSSNTSQSWIENIDTVSGSVLVIHNSQDEFYDGEFSGSNITVTTQILNPSYPTDTTPLIYNPVYYYGTDVNEENIFKSNFLNSNTSPKPGEILFFENILSLPNYQTQYLKISKIDSIGNNNTIPLGQIDKIIISIPNFSYGGNIWMTYNVTQINETSQYYLYVVTSISNPINPSYNIYTPSNTENQVLNYYVSSSKTTLTSLIPAQVPVANYNTISGNSLGYFTSSSGEFVLQNTPNTPLLVTASFTVSQSGIGSTGTCSIAFSNGNNITTLSSFAFQSSFSGSQTISASFYGVEGQILAFTARGGFNASLTNVNLLITQSRAVSSSNGISIVEPYITTANFYNSDENALLNSIDGLRDSSYYMNVDYSSGITTPVNFNALVSGSAIKAKIQDSNYTTKRHIIPRYLGSRSTSQQLNTWTSGDNGTYGKSPTIESLESYVAYAPSIGGWSPELMNASAVFVKYLIDQNGDVIIPNTSENSLAIIQQNFKAGDKVKISLPSQGSGEESNLRTIIRGGSRVEPILYTQSGSSPLIHWTTLSLKDIIPGNTNTAAVRDFRGFFTMINQNSNPPYSLPIGWGTTHSFPIYSTISFLGANAAYDSGYAYEVTLEAVQDGVSLIFGGGQITNFQARAEANLVGYRPDMEVQYYVKLVRTDSGGNFIKDWFVKSPEILSKGAGTSLVIASTQQFQLSSVTIPPQDVKEGDRYYLRFYYYSNEELDYVAFTGGGWSMQQYPNALPPVVPSIATSSSIWGYYDKINYPRIITSSNTSLVSTYGNPEIKQTDITGSGFNPISLPWSVKYADEFRFEGREDLTYPVYKIFPPDEDAPDRLSPTGSIEVHFSQDLPVSASFDQFNLDHFLIRRYVDDASQIIIKGFRPNNTDGPYIASPEYVTPSLNKNVDTFITDLTQKGLL
jgi:hypothetical protein